MQIKIEKCFLHSASILSVRVSSNILNIRCNLTFVYMGAKHKCLTIGKNVSWEQDAEGSILT
jgi:hypothetical protein